MMNQIILVGRIAKEPELIETESGKRVSNISLAVPRSFKNADGEYETDFIDVSVWNELASTTVEYCKKGDVVGVKGRLQVDSYEKDGEKKYSTKVIAERLTFLQSKQRDEQTR